MADIQFEEEQYRPTQQIKQKSFFVRLVLSTGIASTDIEAQRVLLVFAIFLFVLAVILWFSLNPSSSSTPLPTGTLVPGPNGSATFTK